MIVFVFVANRFLDNITSLSGHKVSFMREKTTSNTLKCLQNELTINFELVSFINRTCNFRTEVYTEPCETSKMELFCENI